MRRWRKETGGTPRWRLSARTSSPSGRSGRLVYYYLFPWLLVWSIGLILTSFFEQVERAALVSAAEAAASKSEAASARAADALAKVASHNAWETERSNLLAELDADRAAFATAQTAEIAKIRQTHDAEIGSLRDALNTSERAFESQTKRHQDELTAVKAACESSRRESLSRMETECIERVAAAEAETTRLRASLADVVSQSEACVNDAVASAYAAWRGELLFISVFISVRVTGDWTNESFALFTHSRRARACNR